MGKFITPKRLETFWATAVNKLTEGINGKKLSSNDLTDELKEKYDKAESNKIDSISVNGERQTIDTDKNVNIEFDAGTGIQDITQEEYDALSEEEKMRDTIYHITDTEDDNAIVIVMLGETSETAYAGDKGKALADKMGSADISAIGDGTLTGAIESLDTNKLGKTANAASASKLSNTSAIGSATKPIYFDANGVPVAGTYELNKSVPNDAVFTDTTYSNATTSAAGLMSASDKSKLDKTAYVDLKGNKDLLRSFSLVNIETGIYLVTFSNLYTSADWYSFGILHYYNNGQICGYKQIAENHPSYLNAYSISVSNGIVTSNEIIQNAKAVKIGYL